MIDQLSKLIVKDLFDALSDREKSQLAEFRRELKIDDETYLQMKRRIADPELHTKFQEPLVALPAPRPLWRTALQYAAILALPLCAAGYFLVQESSRTPGSPTQIAAQSQNSAEKLVPQRKQPRLMLADGSVVDLTDKNEQLRIADNIVHTNGAISYQQQISPATPVSAPVREPAYNTITIPEGGDYKVILSDGTTIYLNEKSVLRYPVEFTGDRREVYLVQGEMYFDVAKNPVKPFVVHTLNGEIRVLGTQFNISLSDKVVTTLVEGSVEVCNSDLCVTLKPHQQATFGKGSGPISIETVRDVEELICWKDNIFYFNDQTLEYILSKVSSWYGFDVRYEEPQFKNRRYYVYIDKYSDLNAVLASLSSVGSLQLRVEGTTIVVD